MRFERALPGPNEVFLPEGTLRRIYEPVFDELERTGAERWEGKLREAHRLLLDEQHAFGIKEGDKISPPRRSISARVLLGIVHRL